MVYSPIDWKVSIKSYRPKGMSVVEPKSYVEFSHKSKDILIRYGEGKNQHENKEVIISIIELL